MIRNIHRCGLLDRQNVVEKNPKPNYDTFVVIVTVLLVLVGMAFLGLNLMANETVESAKGFPFARNFIFAAVVFVGAFCSWRYRRG